VERRPPQTALALIRLLGGNGRRHEVPTAIHGRNEKAHTLIAD